MAAESLEQGAAEGGHDIRVDIRGAIGAENEPADVDVGAADAAIIASDTSVSRDRFSDVTPINGTLKDTESEVPEMITTAIEAPDGDIHVSRNLFDSLVLTATRQMAVGHPDIADNLSEDIAYRIRR